MKTRTIVYDKDLRLEACRLREVIQPFPNHVHEYYVIGLVEEGQRILTCKNRTYAIAPGSVLLFNPGDSHACVQSDGGVLDYRSLSISQETMLDLAEEAAGARTLPVFSPNAILDEELSHALRTLHEQIMRSAASFEKEESLLLLLSSLLRQYGSSFQTVTPDCPQEVERACAFMVAHYADRLSLDQICRHAGLSKSTLLRAFTKARGVTPYRYLESVRIDQAKRLLAQGASLTDAALRSGFSDQSHFTNYFTSFTGLSPGAYRDMFRDGRESV